MWRGTAPKAYQINADTPAPKAWVLKSFINVFIGSPRWAIITDEYALWRQVILLLFCWGRNDRFGGCGVLAASSLAG
jgi:hypothetical protein